ncbi:MAG: response regulator transcription factor [Planctomycetota bacterium]
MSQAPTNYPFSKNENHQASPRVVLLNKTQWSYLQRRYHMTPRELQIAQLICQGLGNEEIANKLNIKHGTVKTHIRNLYRKLWVHNKILMLLRFIEDTNGLLSKATI